MSGRYTPFSGWYDNDERTVRNVYITHQRNPYRVLTMNSYNNDIIDLIINRSLHDAEVKRNDNIELQYPIEQWDKEDTPCTICLEPIKQNDNYCEMKCSHNFHADCIRDWVKYKQSCPVCRAAITDVIDHDHEVEMTSSLEEDDDE